MNSDVDLADPQPGAAGPQKQYDRQGGHPGTDPETCEIGEALPGVLHYPGARSYEAEAPSRHYFPLRASRFATYVKVERPQYFAIRPVR